MVRVDCYRKASRDIYERFDARNEETTCRPTTSNGITNMELNMVRRGKRGRG